MGSDIVDQYALCVGHSLNIGNQTWQIPAKNGAQRRTIHRILGKFNRKAMFD